MMKAKAGGGSISCRLLFLLIFMIFSSVSVLGAVVQLKGESGIPNDAFVQQNAATSFHDSGDLAVHDTVGAIRWSYLMLDLSSVNCTSFSVSNASLFLTGKSGFPLLTTVRLFMVNNSWQESNITWNTRVIPVNITGQYFYSQNLSAQDQVARFEITDYVKPFCDAGYSNVSIIVNSTSTGAISNQIYYSTDESQAYRRPEVNITTVARVTAPVVIMNVTNPVNNSIHNENTIQFYANASDNDAGDRLNCTLFNNESFSKFSQNFNRSSQNSSIEWFNDTLMEKSLDFWIGCTDGLTQTNSSLKRLRVDRKIPFLVVDFPVNTSNPMSSFFLNSSCSDPNLFELELNISRNLTGMQMFYFDVTNTSGINGTHYFTNLSVNTSSWFVNEFYDLKAFCGDSHTLNDLGDLTAVVDEDNRVVSFSAAGGDDQFSLTLTASGHTFNGFALDEVNRGDEVVPLLDASVSLSSSLDEGVGDVPVVPEKFKLGIFFEPLVGSAENHTSYFTLHSSTDKIYLVNPNIGHFVIGQRYIDFAPEVASGSRISISQLGADYVIGLTTDKDFIDPQIGNVNNVTQYFQFLYGEPAQSNITCLSNPAPDLKVLDRIEWVCQLDNAAGRRYDCLSQVRDVDGNVVQVNPDNSVINKGGVANTKDFKNTFTAQDIGASSQFVNVYFNGRDLFSSNTYTFEVLCRNNATLQQIVFSQPVIPAYASIAGQTTSWGFWFKTNIGYLIFGFAFLIIILILWAVIWNKVRHS